ncbi:hypothetical protein X777_15906, partial [Ooceraea biroi]
CVSLAKAAKRSDFRIPLFDARATERRGVERQESETTLPQHREIRLKTHSLSLGLSCSRNRGIN